MQIQVKGPWTESHDEAVEDQKKLIALFGMQYGFGIEGVRLTEGREWRATADIDLDDYTILRK